MTNKRDKQYEADMKDWFKQQQLKIALLENDVKGLMVDIALSRQQLALSKKRITFFKGIIADGKKTFEQYQKTAK